MRARAIAAAAALAMLLSLPAAASAATPKAVPPGWLATVIDGPLTFGFASLPNELASMHRNGVESARIAFEWSVAQPFATAADVPEAKRSAYPVIDGVPTNLSALDTIVLTAARKRMPLHPVVLHAPAWARKNPSVEWSPPKSPAAYAAFLGILIHRYGTHGTLWAEHRTVRPSPIRDWQIWNEPNGPYYWTDQPFGRDYIDLLAAAYAEVKHDDPPAKVVLAGLVGESWTALERIYALGGAGLFDQVAIHPFTYRVSNLLLILRRARAIMDRHGDDRMPIVITEMTWPSAAGKVPHPFGYEVSPAGQASRVRASLTALAKARRRLRIARVTWYTWIGTDRGDFPFDYSGLKSFTSGGTLVSKPALAAFHKTARTLERCRRARIDGRCK